MDCTANEQLMSDFFLRFNQKILENRIPLTGCIELTKRCNFNCVHCYLPDRHSYDTEPSNELDTPTLLKIIDDISDAGCLFLLLSGGEPLLRKDFNEIYTHAKNKGMMVSVFTNGSVINQKHIELFRQLPPMAVEISLYGASEQTYKKITGCSSSFRKVMTNIERLKTNDVPIILKTILMDYNRDEFKDIESIAKKFNVKFLFDAQIIPRLNGNQEPLARRLTPEEAVDIEFSDPSRAMAWKKFYERGNTHPNPHQKLYTCSAGKRSFHISSQGILRPCLMVEEPSANLNNSRFIKGWTHDLDRLNKMMLNDSSRCISCDFINLCGYCPPFSKLEDGTNESYHEFLCRFGRLRYEKISEISNLAPNQQEALNEQ